MSSIKQTFCGRVLRTLRCRVSTEMQFRGFVHDTAEHYEFECKWLS